MHYFIGHRMESGKDGFTVVLYLDDHRTEFAGELGDLHPLQEVKIHDHAVDYIKRKFPDFKVNLIKVMLGSILVTSIPMGGVAFAAESPSTTPTPSTTQSMTISNTTYKVVAGDSLYAIARKFNTTIDAIKQANHLTSDNLYIGQSLIIPATTITPTPIPVPATQQSNYTVVSGDTLYTIAKKFNTTIDAIKQANKLTSDNIYIGQALIIPATTVTPTPTPAPTQQTNYTVVSGDSLYAIARKFNTTIDAIRQANHLTSDNLFIGQTLIIPVTTVTPTPTPTPAPVQQTSLTIGASGTAVENLQRDLQGLGFFTYSSITGYFGNVTAQAVKDFQTAYNLPATGVVDQATQTQIDHALVKKDIVADAPNYTGVPYVWGGASPTGFDCSGFVYYMFNTHGVDMNRTTSRDLYNMGTPVDTAHLQPGDLVFFAVNEPGVISHVGIYIGNNEFISATSSKGIWTYSLGNSFWAQYYVGAHRVY